MPAAEARLRFTSMIRSILVGRGCAPLSLERPVPDQLAANGFRLLEVDLSDVARIVALPFHHRHPSDRLLVAQAPERQLRIVSADRVLRRYGVAVVW